MFLLIRHHKDHFLFAAFARAIVCVLSLALVFSPASVQAQSVVPTLLNLPVPGTMVLTSASYNPAIVTGIKIYPDNPLQFDFIIDIGDDRLQGEALKAESQKLINYFMATLTVPEDEMWVNLSPYEKDRIIAEGLSHTEMGRDMLAQDYLLKQFAASMMYPERDFGREFWRRVHAKAQEEYGTTEIPMNTFNKIWIVPDEAVVYVHDTNVFVAENHLKVMLEEDYLALESNAGSTKHGLGNVTKGDIEVLSGVSAQIVREVLLPEIEREVNQGKNFANLRQMYNSMLLATWYKKNLKESLLGQIYADQNKVSGIELEDKDVKQKVYDRYLEAFEKGVYNYIKEDIDLVTQAVIPRKYFSGGLGSYRRDDGTARFSEAKGSAPVAALNAIGGRSYVSATVNGQILEGGEGSSSSPLDLNQVRDKGYNLDRDELRELFGSLFREMKNASGIKSVFMKHIGYFEGKPERLEKFLKRFQKYKGKIDFELSKSSIFDSKSDLIDHVLFLNIVRGTIKDLVWEYGEDSRAAIIRLGGDPVKLYNIFVPEEVRDIFFAVANEDLVKPDKLGNELEWVTGHKITDFRNNPELFVIFADEVANVLKYVLYERKKDLANNADKLARVNELLAKLNHDAQGELGFQLANRSFASLKGGNLSGDCTACGGMNYWTVGAYNASFENNELRIQYKGEFFARMIFIVGESDGKTALWVHGVEFTPLAREGASESARDSKFVNANLQAQILEEGMRFIVEYTRRAGIDEVFMTNISNSHGFVNILKNVLSKVEERGSVRINVSSRNFALFNGLNSVHKLVDSLIGQENLEKTERIYLQGFSGSNSVSLRRTTEADRLPAVQPDEDVNTEYIGGVALDRTEINRAAPILMQMVREEMDGISKNLRILGHQYGGSFRDEIKKAIRASNVREELIKLGTLVKDSALLLVGLLDPAAYNQSKKEMESARKAIVVKGEQLSRIKEESFDALSGQFKIIQRSVVVLIEFFERYFTRGSIENEYLESAEGVSRHQIEEVFYQTLERLEEEELIPNGTVYSGQLDEIFEEEFGNDQELFNFDDARKKMMYYLIDTIISTLLDDYYSDIYSRADNERMPLPALKGEEFSKLLRDTKPDLENFDEFTAGEYIESWQISFWEKIKGTGTSLVLSGKDSYKYIVKRPSPILKTHGIVETIFRNINDLNMDSESILTIVRRINPGFDEEFRRRMGNNFSQVAIDQMGAYPAEVIDFYRRESVGSVQKDNPLQSPIKVFSLNGLSNGGGTKYLPGPNGSSSPVAADSSQTSKNLGGIDFNPQNVRLKEQGDKMQVHFSASGLRNLTPEAVTGILPRIISITPLPSLLQLLGLEPQKREDELAFAVLDGADSPGGQRVFH